MSHRVPGPIGGWGSPRVRLRWSRDDHEGRHLLLVVGLILAGTAFAVGFPRQVAGGDDEVFVIRGAGATAEAELSGPVSPADGNLWIGAAVPTLIIGVGLVLAGRHQRRS